MFQIINLIEHFKYISHKEALDKMSLEKLSPHMAVTKQVLFIKKVQTFFLLLMRIKKKLN